MNRTAAIGAIRAAAVVFVGLTLFLIFVFAGFNWLWSNQHQIYGLSRFCVGVCAAITGIVAYAMKVDL